MRIVSRVLTVAFILFCFEIGFFLILVPWSALWESSLLFLHVPGVRSFVISTPVRTLVTFLGGFDLLIGISELRRFFRTLSLPNAEESQR